MINTFFLSSHDYISSPQPRTCQVLAQIEGASKKNYLRVSITPPIPAGALWPGRQVTEFYLLLAKDNTTLDSIGTQPVFVYIFVSKKKELESLPIEETDLAKVGTGMLHARIEDAIQHSAMGD